MGRDREPWEIRLAGQAHRAFGAARDAKPADEPQLAKDQPKPETKGFDTPHPFPHPPGTRGYGGPDRTPQNDPALAQEQEQTQTPEFEPGGENTFSNADLKDAKPFDQDINRDEDEFSR